MSQISLKPLDDGQKAVEIPLGKTTIGRGPLLGCSDKKVSRNHAVLEVNTKKEVFLTPTHVNPCFYQPTAESPGQILKKDAPHKLENGDTFSLLPRAYRYQLIVQGESKNSSDRNEVKPSEKTNGSTGSEPEDQLSGDKESSKEAICDKPADKNVIAKTFSKLSEASTGNDKNHSKNEEGGSSQKSGDNVDDSKSTKDSKEKDEKSSSQKEKKSSSEAKSGGDSTENCLEDAKKSEEASKEDLSDPAAQQSGSDDEGSVKSDCKASPSKSKEDKDSFDDRLKNEDDASDGTLSKEDQEKDKGAEDKKMTDDSRQSLEEETIDTVASKDSTNDADADKTRLLPDWTEEESPAPTKGSRKRGLKKVPKPKATASNTPKPKGRKKAKLFDFGEESSSTPRPTPGRTSSRTNRQTRQGLSLEDFVVSDDDEWQSDGERPKRRRRKKGAAGARKREDSGSDWETDRKKPKKAAQKGEGSGSESDWGTSPKKGKKILLKGKKRKDKPSTNEGASDDEPDNTSSNAVPVKKNRINCTYGKKCFRRNQNHLDQFCHPGDPEYIVEAAPAKNDAISESEGEPSAPKKECPYGENCFRKNPQHKKDFKHTKKVRPLREGSRHADKRGKGSSDEIDSYDLDESLRDDSADEYKPVDSGSDYETKKPKRLSKAKAGGKTKRGRKA